MSFEWESPKKKEKLKAQAVDGKPPVPGLTFQASINSVRTAIDGGFNLVLDIPETNTRETALLLALRGRVLEVKIEHEQ